MQAEAVQHSLASRIVQLPEKARKQLEAFPVKHQGVNPWLFKTLLRSHARLEHLPATCDLKKHHFDGGCGVLYAVSPFRNARLQVLNERQNEAAWFANLQPLKVRHSDKEGTE